MKKFLLIFGLAAVILTGCAHKKADKLKGKKEEITTNLPIISQAEKQEVITKKLVFPKDEQGIQSSQIITYQGKRFIKVIMERITPTDDSIKNAIKEVGLEETQRLLDESMQKDTDYTQAKTVAGFTGTVQILNENELKITSTYDFDNLDIEKALTLNYFKNSNLKEMTKMPPEEYINNLLINGAEEQQ